MINFDPSGIMNLGFSEPLKSMDDLKSESNGRMLDENFI